MDNTDVSLSDTQEQHDERFAPRCGPLHSRRERGEIPGKIKTWGFGGRASGKTGTKGKERKLGSRLQKTIASLPVDAARPASIFLTRNSRTFLPSWLFLFYLRTKVRLVFVERTETVLSSLRSQESSISISSPEGVVPKRI